MKKIAITVGYDLAQIFSMLVLIVFYLVAFELILPYEDVMPFSQKVQDYVAQNSELPPITPEVESEMDDSISTVKSFFLIFTVLSILTPCIALMISALFRGLVYSTLKNKKFTLKYYKKFLLWNSIWLIFWLILFLLTTLALKTIGILLVLPLEIIIFMHFSTVFRKSIDEKGIRYKHEFRKYVKPALWILLATAVFSVVMFFIAPIITAILVNATGAVTAIALSYAAVVFISGIITSATIRKYYVSIK